MTGAGGFLGNYIVLLFRYLNKEVLDTLVDKNVLGTTNCCQYYLTPTTVLADEFESLFDAGAFPPNSFVSSIDEEGNLQGLYFIFLNSGALDFSSVSLVS